MFQKATKEQAKLRLAIDGVAGSGKTYSSLILARELGGRCAVIDTEYGSASKYADLFSFDSAALQEFSLDTYLRAIGEAKKAGYEVLVIDSLSHAWSGKGGALEEVGRTGGNNKFANGWRAVTPKHNQLVEAMLSYPGHLIATMRRKTEYVVEEVNGKKVPRKVGLAPVQREGMEYEFDVVCDLDIDGSLHIAKTRCSALAERATSLTRRDLPEVGGILKAWLTTGAAPAPKPSPVAAPPPPAEWSNGAPASERALVEVALTEADTIERINALVPRIKRLPVAEQTAIRPLFGKRLEEVRRAAPVR